MKREEKQAIRLLGCYLSCLVGWLFCYYFIFSLFADTCTYYTIIFNIYACTYSQHYYVYYSFVYSVVVMRCVQLVAFFPQFTLSVYSVKCWRVFTITIINHENKTFGFGYLTKCFFFPFSHPSLLFFTAQKLCKTCWIKWWWKRNISQKNWWTRIVVNSQKCSHNILDPCLLEK